MDYKQILQQLCSLAAPSGFERQAAVAAAELLKPWVDEVQVDKVLPLPVLLHLNLREVVCVTIRCIRKSMREVR